MYTNTVQDYKSRHKQKQDYYKSRHKQKQDYKQVYIQAYKQDYKQAGYYTNMYVSSLPEVFLVHM